MSVSNKFIKSLNYQIAVKSEPKPKSEDQSAAERTKLRRQRLDKIAKKEKMRNLELFKNYLNYPSPSNIYKALNETKSLEENNTHIALTNALTNFKNKAKNIAENEIVNIVEKILDFNRQKRRENLKKLTPSQMLSILLISLAQLKAGNNSEKLKNEIRQLL